MHGQPDQRSGLGALLDAVGEIKQVLMDGVAFTDADAFTPGNRCNDLRAIAVVLHCGRIGFVVRQHNAVAADDCDATVQLATNGSDVVVERRCRRG